MNVARYANSFIAWRERLILDSAVWNSSIRTEKDTVSRRSVSRFLGAMVLSCFVDIPCQARIPTDTLSTLNRIPQIPSPEELIGARKAKSPSSPSVDIKKSVAKIVQWTQEAEQCFEDNNFSQSLSLYNQIVKSFPDLAITEYARLHRAFCFYELGEIDQSLLELNDLEISLRGYPEVHASLAVLLYSERPMQRDRSEEQWDLALEFDHRYSDQEWVKKNKKWGPRMMKALNRFLSLD